MESKKRTLQELSMGILVEMERLNYLPSTITVYRKSFNKIIKYASEKFHTEMFSETIGIEYLKENYGYPGCKLTSGIRHNIRCIKKIGEYQLYGAFIKIGKILKRYDWSKQDADIIDSYVNSVQASDTSDATKKIRTYHIKLFYNFLGVRGIMGIKDITTEIISDYIKYMHGYSLIYVKHRLATLRYYFGYLHANGYCDKDFSYAIPRIKAPQKANVPALWSKEDIEKLLHNIDRGNPTGKRNYAVICLVVKFGIRIRDLAEFKLEHLKWERREIEFSQHKTGNKVIYPILNDIGWAIIDYLRNGRPRSESSYLFLSANAPHEQLKVDGFMGILNKQMRLCGINKERKITSGMHSLRHALARNLMEQNVPLTVLSEIMGHTSITSSSPYLKVDIEGLRCCSISLEGN